MYQTHIDKY